MTGLRRAMRVDERPQNEAQSAIKLQFANQERWSRGIEPKRRVGRLIDIEHCTVHARLAQVRDLAANPN
jgi:hypothetical protein